MTSQRTDVPGSKPRQPIPSPSGSSDCRRILPPVPPAEDVLSGSAPPTDDTPTIISRNAPTGQFTPEIDTTGIRGRQLAHFELIEPIGVGGMAAVLRARDTQLDRFVALKILPPDMATDPENIRRFHQEARSAAKLDHENIARVFFCGEDQRLHFIAFEFVEGENLRAVIEKQGRLSVARAIHYMIQIAAGLSHASARGVVHRDIKPSNIIITPTGRAKLVDMGLARSMERQVDNELTQSGVTLGTFDYISPEQALEPREADVRSDIYSLGCTFYHALTGRTPMPDGNPAKKLHCQQNHKPIDPREFVPDLPLAVVQILDRMMAKNPRDRFQTPEELVHRLLLAAKQLGINPDVPEGVLTVEAAVPAHPVGRPLLWIGAAAVAVVALVLALDPLSNSSTPTHQPAPPGHGGDNGPSVKDNGTQAKHVEPTPPVRPENNPDENIYTAKTGSTVDDLIKWLKARPADVDQIELRLAGDLDLSGRKGGPTLLLSARQKVVIKPSTPRGRVTIRLAYPDDPDTKTPVALTIAAPQSTIEGIRFLIDGKLTPDTQMTALHLKGGKHTLEQCEFIQVRAVQRTASLVAESGRFGRAEVTLNKCVFLGFGQMKQEKTQDGIASLPAGSDRGGQDAIVRQGAVKVTAENCVFGPHAAAFRLEGDGGEEPIAVKRCSILLPAHRSAAFDLADRATCKLDVQQSLIARVDVPATGEGEGSVLIRQADDRPEAVVYQGKDNGYHDLDGYWAVGDGWRAAGWGAFRLRNSFGQDSSRLLLTRPWLNEPAELVSLLDQQKTRLAFQLDLAAPALRKPGRSTTETIGTESTLGEALVVGDLPALSDRPAPGTKRFLIVEEKTDDGPNGIYPNLHQAAAAALPGDTILIRHDGELEVEPISLNRKTQADLTIRPARRFRPILTLGEATENDAALFRVQDGKLRLEGLEFRLEPSKPGFKLVTVATLAGDGLCEMRGCVATLEKRGETAVALAALAARPDKEMKLDMPPARTRDAGPKLLLVNTFIRGEGDLLWAKTIRPCELDLKSSVVALSGSLFSLDVAGDSKAPPVNQSVVLGLRQSTTYLGGHLVRLVVSKDPRGIVPVKVKAEKCLFVASANRALIQLDGAEEKVLKEKFTWEGGPNAYGGYSAMQAQNPGGEEMAPPPLSAEKWKMLQAGEGDSAFSVKLTIPSDARYPQMSPTLFARTKEAGDCGADVAAKGFPRPR